MAIDPVTMAIIASTIASAGGSILGAAKASDTGGDSEDERLIFPTASANPLQSGLSLDALLNLGLSGLTTSLQASPIEQAIAEIQENPTLNTKLKRRAVKGLSDLQRKVQSVGNDPAAFNELIDADTRDNLDDQGKILFAISNSHEVRKAVGQALGVTGLAGFANLRDLANAEAQFRATEFDRAERNRGVEEGIRDDRIRAFQNLTRQTADFPTFTNERIEDLIARATEEEDARLIHQANRYGFAPSAKALSDSELRAIDRVNAALAGQQALGLGAISGISAGLNPTGSAQLAISLINSGRSGLSSANSALVGSRQVGQQAGDAEGAGIAGAGQGISSALLAFADIAASAQRNRELGDILSSNKQQEALGVNKS